MRGTRACLVGMGLIGMLGACANDESLRDVDTSSTKTAAPATAAAALAELPSGARVATGYATVAYRRGTITMTQLASLPEPTETRAPRAMHPHAKRIPQRFPPPPGATPAQLGLERPTPQQPDAPSPPIATTFAALDDDGNYIPPDTNGAVGPRHLMTALNSQVRIQDRAGTVVSTVLLTNFFTTLGANVVFDPHIEFDPDGKRWIMVAGSDPQRPTASILIGVSATDDPTGQWFFYAVKIDPVAGGWGDFPLVGFNKSWIAVTINVFNAAGTVDIGCRLFAFDKADLYAHGAGKVKVIDDPDGDDIVIPARVYDANEATIPMLFTQNGSQGAVKLLTLRGTVGNEQFVVGNVIQSSPPLAWEEQLTGAESACNIAPQLSSAQKICTGDNRFASAVLRNGKLWATHTVYLPVGVPTRAAVQWWQIDPVLAGGTVLQQSRVEDPTGVTMYAYSAIAVNKYDDALIGYSRFSPTQFPGANYSYRGKNDPKNTLRQDTEYRRGEAPYYKTFGHPRNRWGDYSNTLVDPVDDTGLWTLQEFSHPGNVWGTQWAKIAGICDDKPDGAACDPTAATVDKCAASYTCQAGTCVASTTPKVCTPPDACHTASCDAATGNCVATVVADGKACNSGNKCSTNEVCTAGMCAGTAKTCAAEDQCNAAGACDPATGNCKSAPSVDGTACDDQNKCTTGDTCTAGACAGKAVACAAPDECHSGGTCDRTSGKCGLTKKPDGAPCATGTCVNGACSAAAGSDAGPAPAAPSSGCSCRAVSTGGSAAGFALAGLGLAAVVARRRRN